MECHRGLNVAHSGNLWSFSQVYGNKFHVGHVFFSRGVDTRVFPECSQEDWGHPSAADEIFRT